MTSIGSQDKFLRLNPGGHLFLCPKCKDHEVHVLEDGSRRCVATGESFEATEKNPLLFEMRERYEQEILAMAVRSRRQWKEIIEMPQPERQALATSFELVDRFHNNRGTNPAVTTVAVVPAQDRDTTVVADAIALLESQGWKISAARAESECDQRTLWLSRSFL